MRTGQQSSLVASPWRKQMCRHRHRASAPAGQEEHAPPSTAITESTLAWSRRGPIRIIAADWESGHPEQEFNGAEKHSSGRKKRRRN